VPVGARPESELDASIDEVVDDEAADVEDPTDLVPEA
jgi:hypothetical protein